jgi:hypothetical protein
MTSLQQVVHEGFGRFTCGDCTLLVRRCRFTGRNGFALGCAGQWPYGSADFDLAGAAALVEARQQPFHGLADDHREQLLALLRFVDGWTPD